MYKKILLAVDGSDLSNTALAQTVILAQKLGSRLRMIHVINDVPVDVDCPPSMRDELRRAAIDDGRAILMQAQEDAQTAGLKAEIQLIEADGGRGRIAALVVDAAEHWSADLIVIGSHGRRGLDRLVMGSVADGVLRTASIPVLVVRRKLLKLEGVRWRDIPILMD